MESVAVGGRLSPSAPVAAAAASCGWLQRPSVPTTGDRAAGAPTSCHPAPEQAFNTSQRTSLGFQERLSLTWEPTSRRAEFRSLESPPLGKCQPREPYERAGLRGELLREGRPG